MAAINRRDFLKHTALATAVLGTSLRTGIAYGAGTGGNGKKVVILGFDGMDPKLCDELMDAGTMPNMAGLRGSGGYSRLGTSMPPQSPVAWANFINGAGPGTHGIFDFIHRDPTQQAMPFFSGAKTTEKGTELLRGGTPFWDYLDEAGIQSTFYDLPANYPPSPSKHGNHKCLSGMGTPDMLGTYGTYQYYSEDGPIRPKDEGGGRRYMLFFENSMAKSSLVGPTDSLADQPAPAAIEFKVYRQEGSDSAMIEIQDKKVLLKAGQWSDWQKLTFKLASPMHFMKTKVSGICRFYLQEASPNLRLYASPVNIDPSKPATPISEPNSFIKDIYDELGLFYTTGFQEDHKALSNGVFSDDEYVQQTQIVLDERIKLLDYAIEHYDDGLLFFYFSSTDLQSHMMWWRGDTAHPVRNLEDTKKYYGHLKGVYQKMDAVVGRILKMYGDQATVFVLSDHGFANFSRQFNINRWLRDNGYIQNADAKNVLIDVKWNKTKAFALGINALYINEMGREKYGIVKPGKEKEDLMNELIEKLEAIRDENGDQVIRQVHRGSEIYIGPETTYAPDLVLGYANGYRASWDTCLGEMKSPILSDNDSAWAADHCCDLREVPGVLFTNKPIKKSSPALIDLAPTILNEFGLDTPSAMEGKNIFNA